LGRTKYHEKKAADLLVGILCVSVFPGQSWFYRLQRALSHCTAMSWAVQVLKISGNDYEYSYSPIVGENFCRSRTPMKQP